MLNINEHPHQRYNPLTGDWILVSPQRALRPWQGQIEHSTSTSISGKDINACSEEENPLKPGAKRSSGQRNPNYTGTYVFTNDHPALIAQSPDCNLLEFNSEDVLMRCATANGTCRVMCYHPDSNQHFATLSIPCIEDIIHEWIRQYAELSVSHDWVQIFENRGEMMGCSNSHPHCQIWATNFLPNEPRKKYTKQLEYFERYKVPLLEQYLRNELKVQQNSRIVCENPEWLVVVPFWAVWPFETLLLPKRENCHSFRDCQQQEQITQLAYILQDLIRKYDGLFQCKFPYSMGWFNAPNPQRQRQQQQTSISKSHFWTLHCSFCPPLLRSAHIRKFMVGYEMFAQAQRDLTAEKAAEMLRNVSC